MDLRLNGKTAIITGGSAGIGLACAMALHEEGVSVVIVGRDMERLATTKQAIQALPALNPGAKIVTVAADMSNAISPGLTATERAEHLAQQNAAAGIDIEEAKARATAAIPLGRAVDPAEIAAMALLLVSDRAAAITGAEVIIDGGQTPGM
ncbi:MAG: SDR family oxidoreductase [Chloroflexota bacterium]